MDVFPNAPMSLMYLSERRGEERREEERRGEKRRAVSVDVHVFMFPYEVFMVKSEAEDVFGHVFSLAYRFRV